MTMVAKAIHYADENFDPRQVDILLATELNKLSFNSRERINEEIHGVCCLAPKETPEMLEIALVKLSMELDNIPCSEKQGFLQSQQFFPKNRYVNDRSFRLMFLRCELFDVRKAAIRLVRHLDFVLETFDNNKELLGRPVRLTDLGPKSIKLLRSGSLQLLPVRDNSGRRVFVVSSFKRDYDVLTRVQIYFYFQSVLSEDVENQRLGLVSLALPGEHFGKITKLPPRFERYKLTRFMLSAPIRFCAVHCCFPDTAFFRLLSAAYAIGMHTSDSTRFRLKFHTGADTEIRYQLMSYGIPVDQLPITSSGKVKSGGFHQWLNVRARIESERMESGAIVMGDINTNIIECPSFNDVAIRPGKSYLCHPGNVRFKELLDRHMNDHAAANRKEKDIISWGIIEEIERGNGRFLEWDNNDGFWTENKDRNSIRTKIPVYFRDHKRNTNRGKRKQDERILQTAITPTKAYKSTDNTDGTRLLHSFEKKRKIMGDDGTECSFGSCLNALFD